jgi:hypothetical protein
MGGIRHRKRPLSSAALLVTGDLSGQIAATDVDDSKRKKRRARRSGFSSMTKRWAGR